MATKPRQRLGATLPKLPPLPPVRKMPVRPKGPRALQALLRPAEVRNAETPPPMPAGMRATAPEWYVYWWLTKRGIDFDFQSSLLGGRMQLGGLVADFILPKMLPPMVLRVQGLAWHYGAFADPQKDQQQKDQLTNMGYQVIDLDEDDVNERLNYVMTRAMEGIDISRGMWSR